MPMHSRFTRLGATILASVMFAPCANAQSYAQRADAMQLAAEIAVRQHLDPAWTRQVIGQAEYLPGVPPLMVPSSHPGARNWRGYRSRFVDAVRIERGVSFWQRNQHWLERAEQRYGVPPEIIVGIIGVETVYGGFTGNTRVLDALATLALDFPLAHPRANQRQAYFRGELETFLALSQQQGWLPTSPEGSYAGAMGIPQFMPSSWRDYAVDFDGDGHIDLWGSEADAIGSVASYFRGYGWQPGHPTHYRVFLKPEADKTWLLQPDIVPSFSAAQIQAAGAIILDRPDPSEKLALIELPNAGAAADYVIGTQNFYVVTRYNHSSFYAMSVIELGRAIAAEMRS